MKSEMLMYREEGNSGKVMG